MLAIELFKTDSKYRTPGSASCTGAYRVASFAGRALDPTDPNIWPNRVGYFTVFSVSLSRWLVVAWGVGA